MARNAFLLLMGLALVGLVACAPAAGRQAIRYEATPRQLMNAISEIGPTVRPGSAYDYFSITSIGEGHVTLQASTTGGISFFFGGGVVTLNFTAVSSGNVSTLAVSTSGSSSAASDSIDAIVNQLDARFERTQSVGLHTPNVRTGHG